MSDIFQQHGAFNWNERATNDLEPAKHFYTKLVDWKIEAMAMTSGIAESTQGGVPGWHPYITVDYVDKVAKKAKNLGGKTIPSMIDTPGAIFTIMTHEKK